MKKTAFIIGAAAVAAATAISFSQAQTSVTSANAVGYVKITTLANKYKLVGMPFRGIAMTNKQTVTEVMGTNSVPDGTTLALFNAVSSSYDFETFYDGFGWDPNTNMIGQSDAFWVTAPADFTFYLLGEVPTNSPSIPLPVGYKMTSYPYPVERSVDAMGWTPHDGDTLLVFNGTVYDFYTYYDGFGWDPAGLVLKPGDGFWYNTADTPTVWNAPKPYVWP